MNEGIVQFERNPVTFYLFLVAGGMWLVNFVLNLLMGDLGLAALNALTVVLFVAAALLTRKPYIRLTDQVLSINLAPIRPFTDIPWSSIQRAVRRSEKLIEVTTSDGKTVKLFVNVLAAARRPELVAALESRLGPLPVGS